MKRNDFDFYGAWVVFIFGFAIIVLLAAPVIGVGKVITTQQALNQECKTNYNLLQVALAGDNLSRICQMKNQTLNIK